MSHKNTPGKQAELTALIEKALHDFNNVLTIILGNSRLMVKVLESQDNRPDHKEILQRAYPIERAAQKGSELVTQIGKALQHVKAAHGLTDIVACIAECRQKVEHMGHDFTKIEVINSADLWQVNINHEQLVETLVSLAESRNNSFTQHNLVIEAENIYLNDNYALLYSHVAAGPYVMLTLSTTGGKRRDRFLQYITYPMTPYKEEKDDLKQVRDFVTHCHGYIHIYSEENHGSVFRLYLPALAVTALGETNTALPVTGGTERVLVVEDDRDISRLAVDMLAGLGYETYTARNMADALQILETQVIDVVFTDLVLEGKMTGIDLAKRVRKTWPKIKILYTSGFVPKSIPHLSMTPQDEFISKPYHKDVLAGRLRHVLAPENGGQHGRKFVNSGH